MVSFSNLYKRITRAVGQVVPSGNVSNHPLPGAGHLSPPKLMGKRNACKYSWETPPVILGWCLRVPGLHRHWSPGEIPTLGPCLTPLLDSKGRIFRAWRLKPPTMQILRSLCCTAPR